MVAHSLAARIRWLIILAIARPMLGANDIGLGNARPLLVVLDDGWGAARDWQKRMNYLSSIVANGEQQARLMALATTTPKSRSSDIRLDRASALKPILGTLAPQALNSDRVALLERLRKNFAGIAGLEIIWLSDGLDAGTAGTFAKGLALLPTARRQCRSSRRNPSHGRRFIRSSHRQRRHKGNRTSALHRNRPHHHLARGRRQRAKSGRAAAGFRID